MTDVYIAIDIGASSGRLMKSSFLSDEKITLEEVHRFKNNFKMVQDHDRWDMDHLVNEIFVGLEKLKQSGVTQCYVGIDTWAIDYCLINEEGQLVNQPISYRDPRTQETIKLFSKEYSMEKLYEKTGIQIQPFNTIFQLFIEIKSY